MTSAETTATPDVTRRDLSEDEPLPCPFCGEVGVCYTETSTYRWGAAQCASCGVVGPEIRKDYGEDESEWSPRALTEWNKRPSTVAIAKEETPYTEEFLERYDEGVKQAQAAIRAQELADRIRVWVTKTNEQMRLEMGEMTSQECRTVRAAMNTLLQPA